MMCDEGRTAVLPSFFATGKAVLRRRAGSEQQAAAGGGRPEAIFDLRL